MVRVSDLREQVSEAYDGLGLPAWPDPHSASTELAYSRVTEPQRYAIVHARARTWVELLAAQPGVQVERLAAAPLDDGTSGRFDRGTRIFPPRPDALPLVLLEADVPVDGGSLAVLHVGVGQPGFSLETVPDCGCDACDHGSSDLLDAIDGTIGTVIDGPLVVWRGTTWTAWWHPEGAASQGRGGPDLRLLMESSRRIVAGDPVRVPQGAEVVVGHSWFG
jgi:hypothetical protein